MGQRVYDFLLYVGFPVLAGSIGAFAASLAVNGAFKVGAAAVVATALWSYAQRVFGTTYQQKVLDKLKGAEA